MTAVLSPLAKQQFFDSNGRPLVGGKLFTYLVGTTTKQATYVNSGGITPNSNPVLLDYRGECNLWVPPNVGYKYVLAPSTDTDPPTHPIWTVDNLVSSQLITLYGGVDTGSANAYVLTFSANFTGYTDGIIIFWIPAHTNTGASTINVNGLGTISITNADGSALVPNEIVASQIATVLIKSGAALLISATNTIYGSFTPAWTGFSAAPATTPIPYRKNGTTVTLIFNPVNGTSNSTSFTMTGLPAVITPTFVAAASYPIMGLLDNSVRAAVGLAAVNNVGSIVFYKDGTQPNWTASGSKGFADFVALTYTL